MATRLILVNPGSKAVKLSGELLAVPTTIPPGSFKEFWLLERLHIDEVDDVTPNLAGGHGEEGP